ncbi:hypothetical protein AXF42_Ash017048 [Apostasia shenzhenica]|uniref:DUF1764 domain-containing protein n=1 Tax=Apostasia shenzhenica TaxID=1088818 RepID=A0A2I0B7J3_9ASPA|nr:hypothetical protein AXF42_Ash017048 [Apostasia shenzhenica]
MKAQNKAAQPEQSTTERSKMGQEIEEIFRANKKKRKESEGRSAAKAVEGRGKQGKSEKKRRGVDVESEKKKKGFNANDSLDNRTMRRKTAEGLPIYSAEELGIGDPKPGGTALCPFDCLCCF